MFATTEGPAPAAAAGPAAAPVAAEVVGPYTPLASPGSEPLDMRVTVKDGGMALVGTLVPSFR